MPNPKIDDKSVYIDREENITKGNISAKRVAVYTYDSGTDTLVPGFGGVVDFKWDYVEQAQATLTDTWTFKTGGATGTTVATIVITYTNSGKATISTVFKTK